MCWSSCELRCCTASTVIMIDNHRQLIYHGLTHSRRLPMNTYPTFPAAPFGLVAGLICRTIALQALRIRACGLGPIPAIMLKILARIVAPAPRLAALARSLAQLKQLARRGTQLVRHAGLVARRMRGGDGALQAGEAPPRIAEGGARGAPTASRGWRSAAGRVYFADGQTIGCSAVQCRPGRAGGRASWLAVDCKRQRGATLPSCETRSNPRDCVQISAQCSAGRVARAGGEQQALRVW